MVANEQVEYEQRIRTLLGAIRSGNKRAFDDLIEAVGHEMRKLSAFHLRQRPPAVTLQTTALVHEAVLRMIQALNRDQEKFPQTKEHLMALASQMMRYTLTDYARKRRPTVSLDEPRTTDEGPPGRPIVPEALQDWTDSEIENLLALDEALAAIERSDKEYGKRRSTAVSLYLFAGMNYREIGQELGVTDDMARRDCQLALGRIRAALAAQPSTRSRMST
jgi:RNA polymerase sigma factor (TIGR02999 family)